MRFELKTNIQKRIDRYFVRFIMYVLTISFMITYNILFAVFVWHPYDKAPNLAIGFLSLLMILFIFYNWKADKRLLILDYIEAEEEEKKR